MVIIEKDWIKYEATPIEERTKEDIEKDIADTEWYITDIKMTDIETLEMLLSYWLITQDIIDLAKESNKQKQQELELLENELVVLQSELDN